MKLSQRSMTVETFREGRHRAEHLLMANAGELGLLGSSKAYQQVWARDSMICSLGLLLCSDARGQAVHQRSLETLRKFQSPPDKFILNRENGWHVAD